MATISTFFPDSAQCDVLPSNLEIKQWWLHSEWDCSNAAWKRRIQSAFPSRELLHPSHPSPNIEQINRIFKSVRGDFALWGPARESAIWTRVEMAKLEADWVREHVRILYPQTDEFPVPELIGIVLWKKPDTDKLELLEGNHRVSAWLNADNPEPLRCIMFVGEPAAS